VEARDGGEEAHLSGGDDLPVLPHARVLVEVPAAGLVEHGVGRRVAQRRGGVVHRHRRRALLLRVLHHRRHHGVRHHVPRDDVHDHAEVAEEAREVLLGVADDERVDGARALHPPRQRVRPDAGDDAGAHHHHGHVAAELPQQHLPYGLGEDVGVGPPEVASTLEAQLLHGLPLGRLAGVAVAGGVHHHELLLGFSDEPQLGVDVKVGAFPQRLAGLDGLLQDEALPVAAYISCMQ
jgi:hypothetical protein